jgi:hypothetical protein
MINKDILLSFGPCMSVILMFLVLCGCDQNQQSGHVEEQNHPRLTITPEGVVKLKKSLGSTPLFDQSLELTIEEVNTELTKGIDVPVPKDMAGGYTHNRHKRNYHTMQKAGALYQILGDVRYAEYVKKMLLAYADMFPTIGLHPSGRSYAPGKLFWQCLNDANWLVYTSQAYDFIYDYLSEAERTSLEEKLFRPYADFLSIENPKFFNRIHNHSTWGCAAVGMIGLVMDDEQLVKRALYGLEKSNNVEGAKDNDGGLINTYGKDKAGFLSQIDLLFSPDGYYTEGPYYQRYALLPFLVFAQSLENARPELGVFQYRDGLLSKAVHTLIDLSMSNGEFYPINDAQKGMSYYAGSVVTAVDIVYHLGGNDPQLLDIVQKQNRVLLDEAGLAAARAVAEGKSKKMIKGSVEFRDGANGDEGGLGLLRSDNELDISVIFKYAAQGMGHGHFDKLGYAIYRGDEEVLQDYGAARFVNIEAKDGGGYLNENKTYAKQSIAHNTIVINEKSHYMGKVSIGNLNHPDRYFFDASKKGIRIASAKDTGAYTNVKMHRTLALVNLEKNTPAVLIDIFNVASPSNVQMDLPFHYKGQVLSSSFKVVKEQQLNPLGEGDGYEHLWLEAKSVTSAEKEQFTWFDQNKFYSLTIASKQLDEVILARTGANDPNFNLRNDPSIIFRTKDVKSNLYVSIIEPHGDYSRASELVSNPKSNIRNINVEMEGAYTSVKIVTVTGSEWRLIVSNLNAGIEQAHRVKLNNDQSVDWIGPYKFYQLK